MTSTVLGDLKDEKEQQTACMQFNFSMYSTETVYTKNNNKTNYNTSLMSV